MSEMPNKNENENLANSIKAVAFEYWKMGAVVIPYFISRDEKNQEWDKKPCVQWKKWQLSPQNEQEFQSLPFDRANGFGILAGTRLNNGMFFCAIDFDTKKLPEETIEKGRPLLKEFRTTKRETTISNGEHLLYFSKNKPNNNNSYHDVCGLELIAEHRAVIMAPSYGYKAVNDNAITEVENVEQMFSMVLGNAGLRKRHVKRKGDIRYCCRVALERDSHIKHEMRLCIAAEYKKAGWGENDIVELFNTQTDFDHDKTLYQVRTADPKKTLTKQSIMELGYCYKECPNPCDKGEVTEKHVQKPTVITEEFIAEEIWDRKGFPQFYVHYFNGKEAELKDMLDTGETDIYGNPIIYVPVDNTALRKGLVIVPSGVTQCTWKELFEKIEAFALKCYDACGQESIVKFLCSVAIGSWYLDRFVEDPEFDVAGAGKFAPIIPIRGPSKSGKNRFAFVLRLLSYRPYFEMSTYRIPSLYRPLDLWRGTLVLDEADFANTNEKSELIHYLNCRATGTPVSRQDSKNPKITHVFDNFGITILTQRRVFDDNATESRSLPYYSEKTEEKIPTVETDGMLKEGLEIQNMLLYLRFKHFKQVSIDKTAWFEDISDPRLVSSLLPLLALSKFEPTIMNTVKETVKGIEKLKVEQQAISEDGIMINMLWEKCTFTLYSGLPGNEHYYFVVFKQKGEGEDEDEKVPVPLIVSNIAEDFKMKQRDVRKILNSLQLSAAGLPKLITVGNRRYRVIWFDPPKFEKRLREFVVDYQPYDLYEKLHLAKPGTDVTDVTVQIHGEKISDYSESEQKEKSPCMGSVTSVTSVQENLCGICLKPIPEGSKDVTTDQGKTVHMACYRRIKDKEVEGYG